VNQADQNDEALDRGLSLFNEREFFEAHEVWEDCWRAADMAEKLTIQGMIQVTVAMHHYVSGNLDGARSVMERALRNLEGAGDEFRRVNLSRLREDLRRTTQQLRNGMPVTYFQIVRR
jgi:predicted metal-dependent hydrolase